MTLTINKKDFSFSPDTLTATGGIEYCNALIHPGKQFLLLTPSSKNEKDVIDISLPSISGKRFIKKLRKVCGWSTKATITCDGMLCSLGILFKLKEATIDTPANMFTFFRKNRTSILHQYEKTNSAEK